MKTVYFVRHGESEGNIGLRFQGANGPLTEIGRKQAQFIAARAKKLPVDLFVSSSLKRAVETAEIIGESIGQKPMVEDFFVERRRPSIQLGGLKDDPKVIEAEAEIVKNFGKSTYRHSDEENFNDLKERAEKALLFLETRPEKNVLVITHGFFLRILVARALFGKELTGVICENFVRTFHMENTGLSVLKYDETKKYWWLWIWNDHAHLG